MLRLEISCGAFLRSTKMRLRSGRLSKKLDTKKGGFNTEVQRFVKKLSVSRSGVGFILAETLFMRFFIKKGHFWALFIIFVVRALYGNVEASNVLQPS